MKKFPKIIAVDLDGTVFGADHRTILPYTAQVLREYIARGALLIPVTGRSKAIIPIDSFPQLRYMICANGGYICDLQTGETLRTAYIAREDIQTAWDTIRDRVNKLNVVMELFVDDQIVVEKKVYEQFEDYADKLPHFHSIYIANGEAEYAESIDQYLMQEPCRVVKLNFPGKSIRECPEIRGELTNSGLFEVTSDGLNLELTRKGCNKGEALLWLCNYLGISDEEVVVFGNGSNDVSMLTCVRYGVAMGNSAEDVRAAAGYCTDSNTEDGIAHFLEKEFPLTGN